MRNDEILLLIGRLNYAWTNTESLLIYVLSFFMGGRKDVAVVTFLTLNTSRARFDLVERLLKLDGTEPEIRHSLVPLMSRMKAAAKVRNKYNHCIYSFDEHGEIEATQLMRIADFNDTLRYGKMEMLDDEELKRIETTVREVVEINKGILDFIEERKIPM
ncbi:hypothetical protein [Nitratireductor basaltis]|uniref:Uncharacterized protein n=1 Tax=Nitratireductor basaltis TaxID=472175 RepID=A0A084U8H4_9HYPH|nr:hypothetical protein [Nitratireductor basaltis]KFB09260.1 hypothetical protein EL18_00275 [Nitratireductor basaltis]